MLAGTFSGLIVIGNLKPLGISYGFPAAIASLSVPLLSVGNILGRMIWGATADTAQNRGLGATQVAASLILKALLVSLFWLAIDISALQIVGLFLAATAITGFAYGANFVLYVNRTGHYYGLDQVGRIYPLVLIAQAISAVVGPSVSGLLIDVTGGYAWSLAIAGGVALVGAVVTYVLLAPGSYVSASHGRSPEPEAARAASS
jgi:OFA family oxalate/formate antiporter-like MFS transporter